MLWSMPLLAAAPRATVSRTPRNRRTISSAAHEPRKPLAHASAKAQTERLRAGSHRDPALQDAIDEDMAQRAAERHGRTFHLEHAEDAAQPIVLPGLYRNGRLVVPAPLKGSHEVLIHQNLMADDEGLERIINDGDIARLRSTRQLVDFPESASLHVNPELAADRRCARLWTVRFAADIAHQYYARFHEPLMVSSAVRTIAYQLHLQRTNGNAAGIGGDIASPHLTGQAIDFGKSGMSLTEIAWMRAYLKPLMDAGKLDVEEEFQQACFHISVYRSYLPPTSRRLPKAEVATLRTP
jgi:hypothetical protein